MPAFKNLGLWRSHNLGTSAEAVRRRNDCQTTAAAKLGAQLEKNRIKKKKTRTLETQFGPMTKIDKKESGFPNSDAIQNKAFRKNNNNDEIQSWCLRYYARLFHHFSFSNLFFLLIRNLLCSTFFYSLPCAYTLFSLSFISHAYWIKLLYTIPSLTLYLPVLLFSESRQQPPWIIEGVDGSFIDIDISYGT